MSPEQFHEFRRQLRRQLHRVVRSSIDSGIPVHREEVIAAVVHFCLEHLQLIIDDKRNNPPSR